MYRHMARFEALERADGATRRVPAIVTPLFLPRVAARKFIVLDKELRYIFRKKTDARTRARYIPRRASKSVGIGCAPRAPVSPSFT